jgi:hypothetical protein
MAEEGLCFVTLNPGPRPERGTELEGHNTNTGEAGASGKDFCNEVPVVVGNPSWKFAWLAEPRKPRKVRAGVAATAACIIWYSGTGP